MTILFIIAFILILILIFRSDCFARLIMGGMYDW